MSLITTTSSTQTDTNIVPDHYLGTEWFESSLNTYSVVMTQLSPPGWDDFGEPPSGCNIGLTVSPCWPNDPVNPGPWNPPNNNSVPEPDTLALIGVAVLAVGVVAMIRKRLSKDRRSRLL